MEVILMLFGMWLFSDVIALLNLILFVIWLIYVIAQLKVSKVVKLFLTITAIIIETGLLVVFMFYSLFHSYFSDYIKIVFLIQLLLISLYKINRVGKIRLCIGLAVGFALAVYMYYNGSVMGEASFMRERFGDFDFYRWITYAGDVIFPFTLIFNILISPFWRR